MLLIYHCRRLGCCLLWCWLLTCVAPAADLPKVVIPEDTFDFGRVMPGTVVEHGFVLTNAGSDTLRIESVRIAPPLALLPSPARIAPGDKTLLRFKLDTAGVSGPFDGVILLKLNDPETPEVELVVTGYIVPGIEFSPMPAFWIAAQKGQSKQASIEIINHRPEPLRIEKVEHATDRFTTRLETIEDAQRYRLTLLLKPDGPVGKHAEPILLYTNAASAPPLRVLANTYLRERVYTFPDVVDFGTWPITQAQKDPKFLDQVSQTLMVYQISRPGVGKEEFLVRATTDLPALQLRCERSETGDRYQITAILDKDKLQPGPLVGTIFIETTDPEFPQLAVPISGRILGR